MMVKSFTLDDRVFHFYRDGQSFTLAVMMGFACLTAGQLQTRAVAMFFTLSDNWRIFALALW